MKSALGECQEEFIFKKSFITTYFNQDFLNIRQLKCRNELNVEADIFPLHNALYTFNYLIICVRFFFSIGL